MQSWVKPIKKGFLISCALIIGFALIIDPDYVDLEFLLPTIIAGTIIIAAGYKFYHTNQHTITPSSSIPLDPKKQGFKIARRLSLIAIIGWYIRVFIEYEGRSPFSDPSTPWYNPFELLSFVLHITIFTWPVIVGGIIAIFVLSVLITKAYYGNNKTPAA